jgi:hypothetical protein
MGNDLHEVRAQILAGNNAIENRVNLNAMVRGYPHYCNSFHTEKTYCDWVKRYIFFHFESKMEKALTSSPVTIT